MKIVAMSLAVFASAIWFGETANAQRDMPPELLEMLTGERPDDDDRKSRLDRDDRDSGPVSSRRSRTSTSSRRSPRFALTNSRLFNSRTRNRSSAAPTRSTATRSGTTSRYSASRFGRGSDLRRQRSNRPSSTAPTTRRPTQSSVRSYTDRLRNRHISFGVQTGPSRWQRTRSQLNQPGGARRMLGSSAADASRRFGIPRPSGR